MAGASQVVQVSAHCDACGPVRLTSDRVRCAAESDSDDGLCEFDCPSCGRLLVRRVRAGEAALLLQLGAGRWGGAIPFELLEEHRGEPVRWDEVLDMHLALRRTDHPQEWLTA